MKNFIVFLLISFPAISFAQKESQVLIDSLLIELPKMKEDTLKATILNQLSFAYINLNPDTGIKYAQKSLTLSEKLEWQEGMAIAYKNFGQNYYQISNYNQALFNYNKARSLNVSKKTKSDILNCISNIYMSQDNLTKALENAFNALKIRESIHYTKGYAQSFSTIGGIYYNLHNTTKAITYYKKALQANEKFNNENENIGITPRILFNLGITYSYLKRYSEALTYFNKGIVYVKKSGDTNSKSMFLGAIASVYHDQGKYSLAIQKCQESINLSNSVESVSNAYCYGLIGVNYFEMAIGNNNNQIPLEKAKKNILQSSVIYKKLNDKMHIYMNYELLSKIEGLKKNYKSALEFYKSSVVYKDSIFNSDNKETIKNLEDKRTIELRDKEIKINKLTLETKEKEKWYLVFGISLLAIIGGLLFYQSRNRKKTNEKLQLLNSELDKANKVKAQFFGILNHDLRSPVANLIHFLHLQKDNPELLDAESRTRMENKTMSSAENLLMSMEDILLWSKGQMENFKPQSKNVAINSLFEDTKNHFSSQENVQLIFENPQNIKINTDENYLKTIIRNLTGNAIKAMVNTKNPIIVWKIWQENNNTFLSISDNGSGGTQEQFKALYDDTEAVGIKTGLGLHLIRDLAKAIDCKISVDSKPNKGTTFTLLFK
jgi:signal transduction histidine kinase